MTESESTTTDINQMAQDYLASVDKEIDEERKAELEKSIKEGQERHERLVQEHGESHNLAQKAEEIIEGRQDELQQLEEVEAQYDTAREEFLQKVADDLELNEQWAQNEVTEAVTHALYGQRDSSYMLFGEEIQSLEDLEELDVFEKIDGAEVVLFLAKDALGQTDHVKEQYQRLESSKSFSAFQLLGEHGSLSPEEVAEKVGEKKGTVNNWLKNPINKWDRLIPFYRPAIGQYGLSTTGRYFYEQYYDSDLESPESGSEEKEEEASTKSEETQATLEDSSSTKDTSGKEDDTLGETDSTDVSAIEDTDEKAEALFSKVSDKTKP